MAIDCPNIFVMCAEAKKRRNSALRALDNARDLRYYKSHERQTACSSHLMGCRSTVGRLTLDQLIGVRIPAPQSIKRLEKPVYNIPLRVKVSYFSVDFSA